LTKERERAIVTYSIHWDPYSAGAFAAALHQGGNDEQSAESIDQCCKVRSIDRATGVCLHEAVELVHHDQLRRCAGGRDYPRIWHHDASGLRHREQYPQ